jgi:trimethylamine:corrinoid methyltransferase-like protein
LPAFRIEREITPMVNEKFPSICTLLTLDQVLQIHDASLEILDQIGIVVHNQNARAIFTAHGCRVDSRTLIVRFPRKVVEQFRLLSVEI